MAPRVSQIRIDASPLMTLVVCALMMALSACAPAVPPTPAATPTESCDLAAYSDAMDPIIDEWRDGFDLAGQTPRIQLSAQVANLQEIRRRASDVDTTCKALSDAQTLVTFAMQKQIDGFLAFMAEKPDEDVQHLMDVGNDYWGKYADKLDEVP